MYRQTLHALSFIFTCALLAVASHGYADPITYQINDYPTEQASGTQSGFITVDESLGSSPGVLEPGEITAWQVTVTGHSSLPDITYGTTSQQGDILATLVNGTVGVSLTELTLPQPSPSGASTVTNSLQLGDMQSGFWGTNFFGLLQWRRSLSEPTPGDFTFHERYRLRDRYGTPWGFDDVTYWKYTTSSFSPLGGGDPWVIATSTHMPEPSSIALAAFGLLGFGYRRRKQA